MKRFTPNMNDDELDDLFREAADQCERYSDKSDRSEKAAFWEKLESRLEAPASGISQKRRRWGYLVILLFLCMGIAALTWLFDHPGSPVPGLKQANAPAVAAPVGPAGDKVSQPSETDHKISYKPAASAGEESALRKLNEEKKADRDNRDMIQNESGPKAAGYVLPDATNGDQNHTQPGSLLSAGEWHGVAGLNTAFQRIDLIAIPEHIAGYPLHTPFTGRQNPSTLLPESEPAQSLVTAEKGGENDKKAARNAALVNHWQFGLTAGPDWSSAAGKGWRTGVGGGLKLAYRFNQKWAVSSGILLDKKLYDAEPGDYDPPDNTWRNYNVKSIDASCTVIDVPLNAEYTVWDHSANRIFISSGLSSFWMHEEKYTYRYKTASGEWDQWDKEMYNKNHHLFSIINFSPGFERGGQHLSMQIAPYIKVPIGGIGYGRVKLYSAGIHFSLQYNLK